MCIKTQAGGFTLIEVMVAAGISSLLLLVLASFSLYAGRSCASLSNYAELETQSRLALDRMSQQVRQAHGVTACTATNLVLRDADGSALEFVYDPTAETLTRIKNGVSSVLLEGCVLLRFDLFQRNPIKGTYDAYPAASPATCKLVQVTWVCTRSLLGAKLNSESVQSAKIVIRKE